MMDELIGDDLLPRFTLPVSYIFMEPYNSEDDDHPTA